MGMPHETGPSQMKMARTRKGGDDAFYGIGGRKRVRHRQSLPYSVLYPIYYPVAEGKAYFDLDNLQENGLSECRTGLYTVAAAVQGFFVTKLKPGDAGLASSDATSGPVRDRASAA